MYIVLYKNNKLKCDYIDSMIKCKDLLNKYNNLYCFKFSKNDTILNINYPLDLYYNQKNINVYNEEDCKSLEYIEIRLNKYPEIRLAINMEEMDI